MRVTCTERCQRSMAYLAVLSTLSIAASAWAAPPKFALAGLAPDDADVLISISEVTKEDALWVAHLSRCATAAIGAQEMAQWAGVQSLSNALAGNADPMHAPQSCIAIRFGHPALPEDWVLATRILDRDACAEGLREVGARIAGNGVFVLPDAAMAFRPCGDWLLASPIESVLAAEVCDRAMVDAVATTDANVIAVVESLPQGTVEFIVRHDAPVNGVTAASFRPASQRNAEIHFQGRYQSSPLPQRRPAKIDLRMIPKLAESGLLVIRESGVGLLDPLLLEFSATIPEVVPPPQLRAQLETERLLVLGSEHVKGDRGQGMGAPVACIAVPLREDSAEVQNVLDAWMWSVGKTIQRVLDPSGAMPEVTETVVPQHRVIKHIDFGPALPKALADHPVGHATALNWTLAREADGRRWVVIATSASLAAKVVEAFASLPSEQVTAIEACTAGEVRTQGLARQVRDLATIGEGDTDPNAKNDLQLLSNIAAILDAFDRVEWVLSQQDEDAVAGNMWIRLPEPITSGQ